MFGGGKTLQQKVLQGELDGFQRYLQADIPMEQIHQSVSHYAMLLTIHKHALLQATNLQLHNAISFLTSTKYA